MTAKREGIFPRGIGPFIASVLLLSVGFLGVFAASASLFGFVKHLLGG